MAVRLAHKRDVLHTIEKMYNRTSEKEDYRDLLIECVKDLPEPEAIPIDTPFCKMVYGKYVVYDREWLKKHLQMEWNILNSKEYVPAIPIEWLKKFANERVFNDSMDAYWHFWGEDLLQMIEQWEKENEKN